MKRFILSVTMLVLLVGVGRVQAGWYQQAELVPDDGGEYDAFGYSVSISGSTAMIGAPQLDSDADGAVYAFEHLDTGWTQTAKLELADPPDRKSGGGRHFGVSVSLSGSRAVIGAYGYNHDGFAGIFENGGSGWSDVAQLRRDILPRTSSFGQSVSISGNTAIVGARSDSTGGHSGAAFIFQHMGTGWEQVAKLLPTDGAPSYRFGEAVAIDGNRAIVGTFEGESDPHTLSGAAYIFEYIVEDDVPSWTQTARLEASDVRHFGRSVSISGNTAIVGAFSDDDQVAPAYVFRDTGSGWTQVAELLCDDRGVAYHYGGGAVSIDGTTAIVGGGKSFIFEETGSTWTQVATLVPDHYPVNGFGYAVAISGGTVIIGAADDGERSIGSAYIFVVPEPSAASLIIIGGLLLTLWRSRRPWRKRCFS